MKARNKKKLALMVGMALSITAGMALHPMVADAQVGVTYDSAKDEYTVSYKDNAGTVSLYGNKDKVLGAINEALSKDVDLYSRIDISGFGESGEAGLLDALTDVHIPAKKEVYLNTSNGGYDIKATGPNAVTVARTGSKTFTISGEVSWITTKGNAEITVANGAKVELLALSGGNVAVNSAENNGGKVNNIDVWGTSTISGTAFTENTTITLRSGTTTATVAIDGVTTVGDISGYGNVHVSSGTVSTGDITSYGTIQVDEGAVLNTSTISDNVTGISGGGSLNAGTNDIGLTDTAVINLGSTGSLTARWVSAKSITANTVEVAELDYHTDVNADTLAFTKDTQVNSFSGTYTVGTLKTTEGNLIIRDSSKLSGTTTLEAKKWLEVYSDVSGVTTLTAGHSLYLGEGVTVSESAVISAGRFTNASGSPLTVKSIDTDVLDAQGQNITATDTLKINGPVENAGNSTIRGGTVTLGPKTSIDDNNTATIVTDNLVVDGTMADAASQLAGLTLKSVADDGWVIVTIEGGTDEARAALKEILTPQNGGRIRFADFDPAAEVEEVISDAEESIANTDKELEKISPFATADADALAASDPFETQLPSASDIEAIAGASAETLQTLDAALEESYDAIVEKISELEKSGNPDAEQMTKLKAEKDRLQAKREAISADGMKKQAARLVSATQYAGKTAAAPGISSVRAASVIQDVMTGNAADRTAHLRETAGDDQEALDHVWFQYKRTDTEVGAGDVYEKSKVKLNNYQLGYDRKIGEKDFLGAYIGTTSGSVHFHGPARSGSVDIKDGYDFGIYGTHLLPKDQYIDYIIHTGKFDSKYNGEKWGTSDTGVTVGYGVKIAANDHLTWNPYIRLSYDRVSVDDYLSGKNKVSGDDGNNWTAKIGINLMDANGLYGGLAYSRGLSGSYNAYINGIAMPAEDFNADVIYLSLGYRAGLSKNVFLDVSAEKTFADYKGWTAAGKVNFYF